MKLHGKVITKAEYNEIEASLPKISNTTKANLKNTVYDQLGREINNPKPVFINDPEDLEKPMTLNGKVLRILRQQQMARAERQIESKEDLENFGEDAEDELQTPYQVVDLIDTDFPDEVEEEPLQEPQKIPEAAETSEEPVSSSAENSD